MDNQKNNVVEEVLKEAGGVVALAAVLGVSQQLVSYWRRSKRFPIKRIRDIHNKFPKFSYQYLVDKSTE